MFTDDNFKNILFSEELWISIETSLQFVPDDLIHNISAMVRQWLRAE